ncbi:MAG: tRNA lysidine(34) synthetase TilS, partial [Bacteroidota bacterium]
RGEESNEDALFLRQLADQMEVPYHEKVFDTQQFKLENPGSTQMVARALRYDWFSKLAKEAAYDRIATAHHRIDSLETSLLNWTKGSGVRGLAGVPSKRLNIIRPLGSLTKEEILKYQHEKRISYREDRSNRELVYTRNRLRLEVFPILREIQPALDESAWQTIELAKQTNQVITWASAYWQALCVKKDKDLLFIDLERLMQSPSPLFLLGEWLLPLGFNADQARQMYEAWLAKNTGASTHCSAYELLIDRNQMIIAPWPRPVFKPLPISLEGGYTDLPGGILEWEIRETPLPTSFSSHEAWLDADRLEWPLCIEPWQPGDRFAPVGLGGRHKKVKDFLTDLKLNRFEKEETLVLKSRGHICWIIGYRVDENYKSLPTSQRSIVIVYKPKL